MYTFLKTIKNNKNDMVERNCVEEDKIIVLLKKNNFKNKLFGLGEIA